MPMFRVALAMGSVEAESPREAASKFLSAVLESYTFGPLYLHCADEHSGETVDVALSPDEQAAAFKLAGVSV